MNTVLIAGASGLIGAAAVERFGRSPDWRVIGLSRRAPDAETGRDYEHLSLDLTDAAACRGAADRFEPVTHVVYTALFEKPGLVPGWVEADQMRTNEAMMRNLMEPLLERAKGLRHVGFLQGTKAYGAHLHPIAIPARENRPRDKHDNFYWLQEDYIRGAQAGSGWAFTIFRPQIVFGAATGVAMNLIPIIGAYAAICRELGLPFQCPGETRVLFEAVDADLIAAALEWASEDPSARNETFNITNGDVMVWQDAWPAIARAVGLEPAFGPPIALSEFLVDHASDWDRIVHKHGLRPITMAELVGQSHHYADLIFQAGPYRGLGVSAFLVSTIKLRQAGFADCIDTEVMFAKHLARMAERGVIPAA
ncbi:MAG TPA: SDR family oxidoreductase [Caulobacteraceae bacterium]|nr:SDR family oxidoreductase [Caulobacteraceae bacterium]